jgi:hypothetical protein
MHLLENSDQAYLMSRTKARLHDPSVFAVEILDSGGFVFNLSVVFLILTLRRVVIWVSSRWQETQSTPNGVS